MLYSFLGVLEQMLFLLALLQLSFSFALMQKKQKIKAAFFFAKIVMLVSEGAETRFAQTAAPSFRYKPPNFFTQKK